jgi:hypothetical protein
VASGKPRIEFLELLNPPDGKKWMDDHGLLLLEAKLNAA